MFKKIALAGLATALLFGAIPAQAGQSWNGMFLNGLRVNGLSLYGVTLKGIATTGVQSGKSGQDTATRFQLVSVKLPPATR